MVFMVEFDFHPLIAIFEFAYFNFESPVLLLVDRMSFASHAIFLPF